MEAMAKHHTYSIEFRRQVAQEYIAGETLHTLAKRHDLSRNLIRIWVAKYEAGIFEDDARAADLLREYEAKDCRAGTPGRTAGARDRIFKGGIAKRTAAEKREYIRHHRPHSFSVAEGCRLMGLPRSTYYDAPSRRAAPSRHDRQFQEGPPPHARARPAAQAPAAVYGHDRQRSRQSDLSGSCA